VAHMELACWLAARAGVNVPTILWQNAVAL
jgi:hypothetical protein